MNKLSATSACLLLVSALIGTVAAQSTPAARPEQPAGAKPTAPLAGAKPSPPPAAPVVVPNGYVIGPEDVLRIVFWRDQELSSEVVVRPDGRISLPLIEDIPAAGFTPEQLSGMLEQAAMRFIADPEATVQVKEIRSRKVSVLGNVTKQGVVPLTRDMNVMEVLAESGGLLEYASKDNITIVRQEGGKERRFRFNYSEVVDGRNVQQNIMLQPGDMVIVK